MLILRADLHVDFAIQQKLLHCCTVGVRPNPKSKETAFLQDKKKKKAYSILNYKYFINN